MKKKIVIVIILMVVAFLIALFGIYLKSQENKAFPSNIINLKM